MSRVTPVYRTEDEVREMALSPFTHIDRTLKQAIEVLSNN